MGQKAAQVVAVVVTNRTVLAVLPGSLAGFFLLVSSQLFAAILPEERADVMYHRYEGGGVTIDGPSVLVRKNIADKVSVSGNYYVDSISSASIDVETSGASRYSEERTEYSLNATLLEDKALLSGGITKSSENDYEAETMYFSVSQEFFGNMSTVNLGYARGNDEVMQNGNPTFADKIDRQNFRLSFTQILTSKLMATVNYEGITEEGFLNNPYRSYRYLSGVGGYQSAQEVYPDTRTSDAISVNLMYYLPWRASITGEYRYFTDDWDIAADTFRIAYTQPWKTNWLFDFNLRWYQQDAAYFYSDLFSTPSQDDKDFRARDKELSEFSSWTAGIGISYQLPEMASWIEKSSITLQWDFIQFEYDNFRDIRVQTDTPGTEPLYEFDANVYRLFISFWY